MTARARCAGAAAASACRPSAGRRARSRAAPGRRWRAGTGRRRRRAGTGATSGSAISGGAETFTPVSSHGKMRVSSLIASGVICGADHRRQVVSVRGGVLVAGLDPRPVGRRAGRLVRAAPEHLGAAHPRVRLELLRRPRLADAWLADEHHQPAVTRERVVERLRAAAPAPLASDEDAARQPVEDVGVGVRGRLRRRGRRARARPAPRRR